MIPEIIAVIIGIVVVAFIYFKFKSRNNYYG